MQLLRAPHRQPRQPERSPPRALPCCPPGKPPKPCPEGQAAPTRARRGHSSLQPGEGSQNSSITGLQSFPRAVNPQRSSCGHCTGEQNRWVPFNHVTHCLCHKWHAAGHSKGNGLRCGTTGKWIEWAAASTASTSGHWSSPRVLGSLVWCQGGKGKPQEAGQGVMAGDWGLETGFAKVQNKNWPDRSRASCTFTRSVFLSIVRGHSYGHHRFEALFMHTYIYLCTNPLSKSIKNKTGENEWGLFLVFYSS